MNAFKREIDRLSAEWRDAGPDRRQEIEDLVRDLEADAREHYL